MNRKLLLVALACGVLGQAQSPVVMVSIDGLRPDYVTQADKHDLKIPNLRRFVSEGTYAEGVRGVLPTVTYPSHTTLVTGVEPAVHGIYNNVIFDPERKNMAGWYWYAQDIRVPTLWDAAAAAGLTTASIGWPVTVSEKNIRYLIPEYWRASSDEDRKLLRAVSTPGLIEEVEAAFGPYPDGMKTQPENDVVRTKVAVLLLKKYHAQFLTLHLSALDHAQHETAPFSTHSREVLEQLDGLIGQLVEAAREVDPKSVFLVVSDHGFVRTDHRLNLKVPFVENGLITLKANGEVAKWEATPWGAGGTAAVVLAHPDDAAVYAKTKQMLEHLAVNPANGIARVLEKDEVSKLGGFPNASFVVDLAHGYQLGDADHGPLITPAPSTGTHGYLPTHPDLRASFFALGAGVAAGRNLGVVDMRQIAPTVAGLLRVRLSSATMEPLRLKP